ncbi:hypothetical protein GCM10020295_35570 [Streptomyces cinereospinus]
MPKVPESGPATASADSPPLRLSRVADDVAAHARACASGWDQDGGLPDSVREEVAASGLLAADLPVRYGGRGPRSPRTRGDHRTDRR